MTMTKINDPSSGDDGSPTDVDLGAGKLDRPRQFIIPNGCRRGNVVFHAHFMQSGFTTEYKACAVRESGTSKVSKVIRFSSMMLAELGKVMNCWVYSKKPDGQGMRTYFFEGNSVMYVKDLEKRIKAQCMILTIGQRCVDWFIPRTFRITVTLALEIFVIVPTQFGSPDIKEGRRKLERSDAELFRLDEELVFYESEHRGHGQRDFKLSNCTELF